MLSRHRAFPISLDRADGAGRRDEVLEGVRMAVAHRIHLDQGATSGAQELAERLRHVYGTTRTNELARPGGMKVSLFGRTLFEKKGSSSAPRYVPPSSTPLNTINPHLVGASIMDPDSLARDIDSLRTYTSDGLRSYRVRVPGDATQTVLRAAPWPDHHQFLLLSHGNIRLLLGPDEKALFGPQVATFVRHREDWRALRAGNPHAGIVLLGCDVGRVDDGPAQQVADHLGVTVYASRYAGWTNDHHLEVASTDHDWGEFRTFAPREPSTTILRLERRDSLSSAQRHQMSLVARDVARDGLRLATELRVTPVVHVTGYSPTADRNRAHSRVQTVLTAFRRQLAAELERQQHGIAEPLGVDSFALTSDVWEGSDVPPLMERNLRADGMDDLERHVLVTVHTPSPSLKLDVADDDDLGDVTFAAVDDDRSEEDLPLAPAPGGAGQMETAQIPTAEEWLRQSAVARWWPSRSAELRRIDRALTSVGKEPFAPEPLDDLLSAIAAWSRKSSATNGRIGAVRRLEQAARARHDRLARINDSADLVALLEDSYDPTAVVKHHVPDVFGRLTPPPPPSLLIDPKRGVPYDYSRLTADEGVHLLRSMDIRRTNVRSADLDPRRWRVRPDTYSTAHRRDSRRWAPDPGVRPLAEDTVRMPQLVHAVWFGSVPARDGAAEAFWETFRESARSHRGRATFVLWTDVTRHEIQDPGAVAEVDMPRGLRLDLLARAAEEDGILLVNVDEVYNDARAAQTTRLMRIERAKRSGTGWAAASDILRVQIVSDFGGMYVDGGDAVTSLDDLSPAGVVATPAAFAIDVGSQTAERFTFRNNVIVAPPRHPLLDIHIERLTEQYGLDQAELYAQALRPPGADGGSGDLINLRRHSVMYRTGPDLTGKVLESVGYRGPDVPRTVGIASARGLDTMAWHPDNQRKSGPDLTLGPATLAFTQDLIVTALRSLSLRDGDLDLLQLGSAVSRHPRPDLVWESLFEFIGSHEKLRQQVRAISRSEDAAAVGPVSASTARIVRGAATVKLPERVLAMLDLAPDDTALSLGRRSEPVRLRPAWSRTTHGGTRDTSQVSARPGRPLPRTPAVTGSLPSLGRRLILPATGPVAQVESAEEQGPWALISRPVPGLTTRPSINRDAVRHLDRVRESAAQAEATRFLELRFPGLKDLNVTGDRLNCNQAVIAVDRMVDGDTAVRIPPSDRADFYGLDLLRTHHSGEYVPVSSYDDVIERIAERPGQRGVVYVGWDGGGHLFNVLHTSDGVVFVDGQTGQLASLPAHAGRIALMRYRPVGGPPTGRVTRAPHVVTDQDGTQWASGSRSARDGEGRLIPDDRRACVEVALVSAG
ncbi:Papain fold toxin 1, glutamine deamidase [Promicromonospora thailandica]|uniref:Papain fold toxin 1, glutamine deamidase n=2 Tax=Promicromonospora thailandica TaxID=765201 RepID=A0A9X2G068_9MICO|nr:Papain fold toxin 1, glutamine deamidase [Promicromonospora thailandica]